MCRWFYRLNIIATFGIARDYEVFQSNKYILDQVLNSLFITAPTPPRSLSRIFFLIVLLLHSSEIFNIEE